MWPKSSLHTVPPQHLARNFLSLSPHSPSASGQAVPACPAKKSCSCSLSSSGAGSVGGG